MELTQTKIKDFQYTLKYWRAAEIQGITKHEWKEYDKIQHLPAGCAFCEYFSDNCENCDCYLKKCNICNGTKRIPGTVMYIWHNTKEIDSRKQAAKRVRETIEKFFKIENIPLPPSVGRR